MDTTTLRSLHNATCKILLYLLANDKSQDRLAIMQGTGASAPTLRRALHELKSADWIVCRNGRYSASQGKIFSRQGKIFPVYDDDVLEPDPVQIQHHQSGKIFSSVKDSKGRTIGGSVLTALSKSTSPAIAEAWAKWIPTAPEDYTNPIGFMVSCLRANPEQFPPVRVEKDSKGWTADSRWLVHGTVEHREYCRAHPDEFDCDCAENVDEDG